MKLQLVATHPDDRSAQFLLQAFENEMAALYRRTRQTCPPQPDGMLPPKGTFLVALTAG